MATDIYMQSSDICIKSGHTCKYTLMKVPTGTDHKIVWMTTHLRYTNIYKQGTLTNQARFRISDISDHVILPVVLSFLCGTLEVRDSGHYFMSKHLDRDLRTSKKAATQVDMTAV